MSLPYAHKKLADFIGAYLKMRCLTSRKSICPFATVFFVGHELIFELRLPIKRCRFGWQHCVFGLGRESFSSHFGNLFQKVDKPRCWFLALPNCDRLNTLQQASELVHINLTTNWFIEGIDAILLLSRVRGINFVIRPFDVLGTHCADRGFDADL